MERSLLLLATLFAPSLAEHWAVIIAGSSGWFNYRHQADVCHSYHILRRGGIPAENIILLTYDDAGDSRYNPFPGQLFNRPTPNGAGGWDVREGCNASYTGDDVNKEMFLAVLTGDEKATGGRPVLKSGPNDRVFINFADHGAVGLIAMPSGSPLYAQELLEALRTMSDKGMYGELVFYLEACESGSMFEGLLPQDAKIYAATAANAEESSYGTYCGADSVVNGVELSTCLGDLFSVVWMEDADMPSHYRSESLDEQFDIIKDLTDLSHVMRYGDMSLERKPVRDFEGAADDSAAAYARRAALLAADNFVSSRGEVVSTQWDSRYIKQKTLRRMLSKEGLQSAMRAELQAELDAEEAHILEVDGIFSRVAEHALAAAYAKAEAGAAAVAAAGLRGAALFVDVPALKLVFDWTPEALSAASLPLTAGRLGCHARMTEAAIEACGAFSDYSLRHVRLIANLCELEVPENDILAALHSACGGGKADAPAEELALA